MTTKNAEHLALSDRGSRTQIAKDVLHEVIAELNEMVFDEFGRSDLHDKDGMQALRFYQKVLEDIGQRIDYRIETGKLPDQELIRLN